MRSFSNNSAGWRASIPYCFDSQTEAICMHQHFERTVIGVNILSLMLNTLHMVILCRLKKLRGTVFHRIIILTSVVDMMDVFSKISTTACMIRVDIVQSLPWIRTVVTAHELITTYKFAILGFAVVDRWLTLAKPFEYENVLFVRRFNCIAILAAFVFFIYTSLKNAFLENEYCIDWGFGFWYRGFSISNCVLLVCSTVNFVNMNVYIFLISKHLVEMRRRSRLTDSDRLLKQAAKYVIVTFVLFHTCFIGLVVILIFRVSEFIIPATIFFNLEYFTFITILLNSCYGILNILTFAWYTSGYRKAVCDLFRVKHGRVSPPN